MVADKRKEEFEEMTKRSEEIMNRLKGKKTENTTINNINNNINSKSTSSNKNNSNKNFEDFENNDNDKLSQEQERQQEIAEEKASLKEKQVEEIEKAKEELEAEKEEIKTGPHGFTKWCTGPTPFFIANAIDAGCSYLPFIGQIIGFFAQVFWWTTLGIFSGAGLAPGFSAATMGGIDAAIGIGFDFLEIFLMGLSLGALAPIIPVFTGIADFFTEYILVKMGFTSPQQKILECYQSGMKEQLAEKDAEFLEKKKAIIKEYTYQVKSKIASLFGKLKKPHMQKANTFLAFLVIGALGPFGFGVITFDVTNLFPLIFFTVILVTLTAMDVI